MEPGNLHRAFKIVLERADLPKGLGKIKASQVVYHAATIHDLEE
jgi:hypothetical protein